MDDRYFVGGERRGVRREVPGEKGELYPIIISITSYIIIFTFCFHDKERNKMWITFLVVFDIVRSTYWEPMLPIARCREMQE
jgi:hypothetical protein